MIVILAAAAALALWPQNAAAAPSEAAWTWTLYGDDTPVVLANEVPDTANLRTTLECDPGTSVARLTLYGGEAATGMARVTAGEAAAVAEAQTARGGGRMVLTGSGMGHNSLNGHAAYSCSKAAVWMLVRILANELRGDGISVNELVPGPVRTAMTAATLDSGGVIGSTVAWVKQPEDVVPIAMMLATYPAPGPTGQSFSLMRRTV